MKQGVYGRRRLNGSAGLSAIAASLALVTSAGTAHAQTPTTGGAKQEIAEAANEDAQEKGESGKEIVVTGTLIRGVAPAGSNTLDVSSQDVKLSGVVDSNALLTQLVPQSEGFMNVGQEQPGRGGNNVNGLTRVPVVRPSLRNLGDSFAGSGSPTLVLIDGHRVVPAGIEQSVVDVGAIPSGILERTEIVLDGTSAVYGSDAVGGTINYIPRKRFDETRVSATYGFADDYYSVSADITTGVKWNGGGLGLGYSFGKNSNLLVGDRDWTIPHNYLEGGHLTSLACEGYGHITVGTGSATRRFLTTTLQEQTNWCELGQATVVQELERHSAFVTFSQDLSDRIRFELSGFYSQRNTEANGGPFVTNLTIGSTNPYYIQVPTTATGVSQQVATNWAPIYGIDAQWTTTSLKMGQISPTISIDVGADWQVRVMGAYGKSKVTVSQNKLDSVLLNNLIKGTTLSTAINPYDIAATQQQSLFGNLTWQDRRDGIHDFYQARVIGDGPLFAIGGGDVRLAVGAEWNKTSFRRRVTDQSTHLISDYTSDSVTNEAVFAELNIPLVSSANETAGVHSLSISASGRYDHYDGTGGTFNPKLAVTYEPVSWFGIRGNWGKSFRAPNAVDRLGASANVLKCSSNATYPGCQNIGGFFVVPTGVTLDPDKPNVLLSLAGTNANLKPETSTNWSIGIDLRPPVVPGLQASATYFNIDFRNRIGFPPTNVNTALVSAPDQVTLAPTVAQINAFASQAPNGQLIAQQVIDGGYNVLYLYDVSVTNLASSKVSGIDTSVRYQHQTGFGSIDASFNGTWQLTNNVQVTPLAAVTDTLRVDTPIFRMSATVGATIGNLRAQLTFQHRSGYDVDPSATRDPAQTHIDSYELWNAAFRYDVNGSTPLTDNLGISVVINNIFNSAPPIDLTSSGSTTNGSTLGRYVQFGIDKAF
jgi:iron complex outermembrane receptor protein